jgi:isoleucyl-tRNA synthetase
VLDGVSRLASPFIPFLSEAIHLRLRGITGTEETASGDTGDAPSVHLTDFPAVDEKAIDTLLERNMERVLCCVTLGRAIRNKACIKVRTPLAAMFVHNPYKAECAWIEDKNLTCLVLDELNVKTISAVESTDDFISYSVKPEYSMLGKRFGKNMKQAAQVLEGLDAAGIAELRGDGQVTVEINGKKEVIEREEVQILQQTADGFVAETEGNNTIILDTRLSKSLIREGMARDLVNRIQNFRKESGFEVSDRIVVSYKAPDEIREVFDEYGEHIRTEILAERVEVGEQSGWSCKTDFTLDSYSVELWMERVR